MRLGNRGVQRTKRFVAEMMRAAKTAGHMGDRFGGRKRGKHPLTFARGRRTAIFLSLHSTSRRLVTKTGVVRRRIIDRLTSSIGLAVHPPIVSNSFLAVCAHLRQGSWVSIVPHSFFHVLGQQADLVAVDIVDPVHSEAIGLVISDREPRSPMAAALLAAALGVSIEVAFAGF